MLSGLLLAGCTSVSPLEQALRLSGNNRVHLEQVLRHYSRIPADSLKYRAACFLIENMPGHGWYEGTELDVYCRWVDSVYAAESYPYRAALHELGLQWPDVCGKLTFHEDIWIVHFSSPTLTPHSAVLPGVRGCNPSPSAIFANTCCPTGWGMSVPVCFMPYRIHSTGQM